jgi:hypothetical protein
MPSACFFFVAASQGIANDESFLQHERAEASGFLARCFFRVAASWCTYHISVSPRLVLPYHFYFSAASMLIILDLVFLHTL